MGIVIHEATELMRIGEVMTLSEILAKFRSRNQRKFITYCVAGLSIREAQDYISLSSYYRWLRQSAFKEVLKNLPELRKQFGEEAINILRIKNALEAVVCISAKIDHGHGAKWPGVRSKVAG
jgi:hypothetical protein